MTSFSFPLLLSLANLAYTSPVHPRQGSHGIAFGPCDPTFEFISPLQCGSLTVPLDYTDESNPGAVVLDILQLTARHGHCEGNNIRQLWWSWREWGADFDGAGPIQQNITAGWFNLINIVPRGTNNTLLVSCYKNAAVAATIPTPIAGNSSDTARAETWAAATIFAETCAATQNETGRFIGTAAMVRDILAVRT